MPNWDTYDEITTPDNSDTLLEHDVSETVVGKKMKKITWTDVKAFLKTYFDTLYGAAVWGGITGTLASQTDLGYALNPPEGWMRNGKIVPSVTSNNLTVALKTLAGNDPSASEPVYCNIGGVVRTITAALSVTKNAATNWMNLGGAEMATKESDLFVYLGYNATDGVVLGFARFPYANIYSDFSATTTNEKYCAISTITNAAAGNEYTVIGRFAATLSATAGFNWSVPTYTPVDLIQRSIYETRLLAYTPAASTISGTVTTWGSILGKWKFEGRKIYITQDFAITTNGTGANAVRVTIPFTAGDVGIYQYANGQEVSGVNKQCMGRYTTTTTIDWYFYDSTYPGSNGMHIFGAGFLACV